MTIDEIFKEIDQRIEELKVPIEKDEADEYLKQFANKTKVTSIDDFFKLDILTCIKCLYYIRSNKTYSIEEIDMLFDKFFDAFKDHLSPEFINDFIARCYDYYNQGQIPKIIEYLEEEGKIKSTIILKRICNNNNVEEIALTYLKSFHNNDGSDMITFLKMLEADPETLLDVIDYYRVYKQMKKDMSMVKGNLELTEEILNSKISNRDKNRFLKVFFNNNYNVKIIIGEVNEIKSYVYSKEKESKEQEKIRERELRKLDSVKKQLEKGLQQEEFTDARKLVKGIRNLTIKRDILQFINNYNSIYYKRLKDEYESLNKNSKAHFQALLRDYGIEKNDDSIELIMHNSIDEVEEILSILKRMNIDFENIFTILENTDLQTIRKIKAYMDKGYFTALFLNNNLDVFNTNLTSLQAFENNLKLLKEYNLNPLLFKSTMNIMFEDTKKLKKSLEVCKEYNLLKYFKTTNNYSFLQDKKLEYNIDRLLELGFENFLEKNLGVLNSTHLKRLEVLHTLSIPIETQEEFETVISDETKFFISEDDLDYYIPNVLSYKEERDINLSKEELDSYQSSPRLYTIGNIKISSKKVQRLLQEGKSIYQAIFSGMNLSEEEYQEILQELKVKIKEKI